jgi:hypothetical protein
MCVRKKGVKLGTGQYFKWLEGITTLKKKRLEINLIPFAISQ